MSIFLRRGNLASKQEYVEAHTCCYIFSVRHIEKISPPYEPTKRPYCSCYVSKADGKVKYFADTTPISQEEYLIQKLAEQRDLSAMWDHKSPYAQMWLST